MQQFRGDEEVLAASAAGLPIALIIVACLPARIFALFLELGLLLVVAGGDAYHTGVDEPLVAGVHALVDFVDDAEGGAGEGLEGHEVKDRGHGAFAARLAVGVEDCEGLVFSVGRLGRDFT